MPWPSPPPVTARVFARATMPGAVSAIGLEPERGVLWSASDRSEPCRSKARLAERRASCNIDSGEARDGASLGAAMRIIRIPSPQEGDGSVGHQTTVDCDHRRGRVRTTLLLSLMCLPYLVFGSVIWAAYHQFGEQSLLDQAPLVAADQTPLKLNSGPASAGSSGGREGRAPRASPARHRAADTDRTSGRGGASGARCHSVQAGRQRRRCDPVARARLDRGDASRRARRNHAGHPRRGGGAGTRVDAAQTIVQAPRSAPGGFGGACAARRTHRCVAARPPKRASAQAGAQAGRGARAGAIRMAGSTRRRTGDPRGCRHRSKPAGCPAGVVGEPEDPVGVRSGVTGDARRG